MLSIFNNSKSKKAVMTVALATVLAVSVAGCGRGSNKNPVINGVNGPNVAFVNGTLTMTMVLKNVSIDAGARIALPNMKDSYLEIGPDFQTNGTLISVGLATTDIKFLRDNVKMLDPLTLPGGRPLPGVADGFMPGFAVELAKLNNMVLYVGPNLIGIFVPVNIGLKDSIITARFFSSNGAQIGNISLVGQDSSTTEKNGGVLLLINTGGVVGQVTGLR
ncbi:hypothetical protein K2X30_02295 [bacterium]|jgi:hypothetical protein|nr:hypothetical protein [bacterium]